MSDPQSSPEPERRTGDRRSEPAPTRRGSKQGFSSRWLGIAGRDLAIVGGALVAIVAAFSLTRPIFTNQTKVGQAITTQAPSATRRWAMALPMPLPAPVTNAMRVASALGLGIRWSLASSSAQYSMSNAS